MGKFITINLDWVKWSLAIFILILSIITRFSLPVEPSKGLVFDEVYFVPQAESYAVNRYYFDPHPPLTKIFLYYGIALFNPDASEKVESEKLGNKVDGYQSNLDMNGIRFFPRVFGSLVPVVVYLLAWEFVNWRRKNGSQTDDSILRSIAGSYFVPFIVGLMATFENTYVAESRYALLSQILLFFIFSALFAAVRYYHSTKTASNIAWLLATGLLFGAAVASKWFALALLPIIIILLVLKEWKRKAVWKLKFANSYGHVLVFSLLAVFVYVGAFAWHFNQIKYYAPAADEVVDTYLLDLKEGTNNTSFWRKLTDWHRLSNKYQQFVPELDYSKDDEIGSHWLDWPIMARPISYYWTTADSQNYGFVYFIGNPGVWFLGLVGVITLLAAAVSQLLARGQGLLSDSSQVKFHHWLLILFFFANWLPYSQISRVMYLYHYLPALGVSMLIFGVALMDFILPKLVEVFSWWSQKAGRILTMIPLLGKRFERFVGSPSFSAENFATFKLVAFLVGLIVAILVLFLWFAPLTYVWPVNKTYFDSLELRREWNLRWPGS